MKMDVFLEYEQQAQKSNMAMPHEAYRLFLTFHLLDMNNLLSQFRAKYLTGEFSPELFKEIFSAADEAYTLLEPKMDMQELSEKERKAFALFRKLKAFEVAPKEIPNDVLANTLSLVSEAMIKYAVRHGLLDIMQLSVPTTLREGGDAP